MPDKKKKSFLSNFITLDDDKEPVVEKSIPAQTNNGNSQPFQNSTPQPQYTPLVGSSTSLIELINISTQRIKDLFASMNKSAHTPDHYEFRKMVDSMGTALSEPQAFNTAFSALSSMGLNKDKLMESINSKYLPAVEADKADYMNILASKRKEKVDAKNDNIKMLTAQNETKRQQIQKLTDEISQNQIDMGKLATEVATNDGQLKDRESAYITASEQMKQQLQRDFTNITTYITTPITA